MCNRVETRMFLLNIIPVMQCKKSKHLLIHIITAARVVFARYWKKEVPTRSELSAEMLTAETDVLSERLKDNTNQKVIEAWSIFCNWLEQTLNGGM